ncbi:hypothetical protein [Nocardia sp. NPDC049526]|uniref:hypothetical protein n=1 Tax=Nocardia sp. NPDC049526 TaxID=3364316 RepID=UPI00378909B1
MVVAIIVLMLVPVVAGSVLVWRYMRPVRVFESADKGANREISRALNARELPPDATAESWIPRLQQAQHAASRQRVLYTGLAALFMVLLAIGLGGGLHLTDWRLYWYSASLVGWAWAAHVAHRNARTADQLLHQFGDLSAVMERTRNNITESDPNRQCNVAHRL